MNCRACDGMLREVLSLGNLYLPRWVDPDGEEEHPRAPLDLMQCLSCELLQLGNTVSPDLLFREFHYRSSMNGTMREALRKIVADGMRHASDGTWLDIGANDGYLLSVVPGSFRKIACEPAMNFQADLEEQSDRTVMNYFSADEIAEPCKVITSCAMFYDVDRPSLFIEDIAKCLTSDGIWINQLNDAPTMLKQNAFDSICHEHLCYYDIHTLNLMYERAGLKILSVISNDVNGGSLRIIAGKRGEKTSLAHMPRTSMKKADAFASRVEWWRQEFQDLLQHWARSGSIWAYGASTKGHILLQYLSDGTDIVSAFEGIAEKNPRKYGKVMPGIDVPILSEEKMREESPDYVLVLPWAFRKEFVEREAETRARGTAFVFPLPNIEVVL